MCWFRLRLRFLRVVCVVFLTSTDLFVLELIVMYFLFVVPKRKLWFPGHEIS